MKAFAIVLAAMIFAYGLIQNFMQGVYVTHGVFLEFGDWIFSYTVYNANGKTFWYYDQARKKWVGIKEN